MYCSSTCLSTNVHEEVWLIDSRASFHMNPHREWFVDCYPLKGNDIWIPSTMSWSCLHEISCISSSDPDKCFRFSPLRHDRAKLSHDVS